MSFAVLVHRPDSIYDDRPDEQYQFPRQYLSRVRAAVGDWIVYYEPTKVKLTRGYFAVARVADVVEDPTSPGMYLALIEPGTYLPFPIEVPFLLVGGRPAESGLLNEAERLSGRAQAAVRSLSPADFNRIVTLGLDDAEFVLPRTTSLQADFDDKDEQAPFEIERERAELLISRPIRDRVFRTIVLRAYDQRCGITGFKFINGGGRAEVDAAHIRPVEAGGPDTPQNGIALSGTAHWMFDRGLIGIADDYTIMISRQINDRDGAQALINPSGKLIAPTNPDLRPHSRYLSWHREHVFKT
jgi:putative restriction endonuclease